MTRSTRITIETESLLVLQGCELLRTWCPQCGRRTEMIPLNTLGVVSNLSQAEIQAWMDASELHQAKTADGAALICLNSLLNRVRRAAPADSHPR